MTISSVHDVIGQAAPMRTIPKALALCLLFLAGCSCRSNAGRPNILRGESSTSGPASAAFMPVHVETGFSQGIAFGESPVVSEPKCFYLRNLVKDGPNGAWNSHVWSYSTSFVILAICGRQKNVFYLLGQLPNGEVVVEEWQIQPESNETASAPPEMARTELYRGSALQAAHDMRADPDGRFLLFLSANGELKRLSLTPPRVLSVEAIVSNDAKLANMRLMYPAQHATLGRCWVLEDAIVERRIVMIDTDNDAVFDQYHTLDAASWAGMGFDGPCWLTDFVNHIWYQ